MPLTRLSEIIEGTRKAVLFRKAGPERLELAAKVAGGRARIAAAFDTTLDKLHDVYHQRLATPQKTIQIPSGEAPVHEIVRTGDEVDLTTAVATSPRGSTTPSIPRPGAPMSVAGA